MLFLVSGLIYGFENQTSGYPNKTIQFVLNMDSRARVGTKDFKSLGWLPVSKRVDQIILNHAFKVKSGQFPDYMVQHFIPASSIHSYGTRFRELVVFLFQQ